MSQQHAGRLRALIVGENPNARGKCRKAGEPMKTVMARPAGGLPRAYLVGGQYGQPVGTPGRTVQCTDGPAFVVTAVNKGDWTGAAGGRVVQMTPRALARFQSFPDWYELPANRALACRVIGNAVPPLLYQRVIERAMVKGIDDD